jgi:hypothetical protein
MFARRSFLLLLLVWSSTACGTRHPLVTARITGTCEEACARYQECKGESRPTCLSECREIFVHNGQPDHATLKDYQELSCDEAISFVEGTGRTARRP